MFGCPVEEKSVREEFTVGAVVVVPGDTLFRGELEDAGEMDVRIVEVVVVFSVTGCCSSESTKAIGVCGLNSHQKVSLCTWKKKKKKKKKKNLECG